MTGLCILAAGKATALAISAFTLSWTHSVQMTEWQEDWQITSAGLVVAEARIKGSGAGMDPPEGAVLKEGWWTYRPTLPPRNTVSLAASGATGEGWMLCAEGACMELGAASGEPVELSACSETSPPR